MINENKINCLRKKSLALFFTKGMSLKDWYVKGIFYRELIIYKKLSEYFKKIYLFTYGNRDDLFFQKFLPKNLIVIPKPFKISDFLYSIIFPLLYIKILKNCDIVKTNQINGSWSALIAKYLYNIIFVNRMGYIPSELAISLGENKFKMLILKNVEKIAFKFSDYNIITSGLYNEYLKERLKVNLKIYSIIPNYVDIDLFKKIQVKKIDNSVVFVGRLSREKNLFNLIKAFKGTNYKLYLIGEGELKEQLKEYAIKNNCDIKFMGMIPNSKLPYLLNQFEIFILPSYFEGMPKALIEAMACGLPVIGTNTRGIREIINDGKNGILSNFNYKSIKDKIDLIMNSPELKNKLSINAIKTILKKYSLETLLNKELMIYRKLICNN